MRTVTTKGVHFNYAPIDPKNTIALRLTARRLEALAQETAVSLWEMGALLASARMILASYGTGSFQQWMMREVGLSITTGYRLLNVHKAFQRESLEETHIAVSALYALAEPSTPVDARTEALQRARQGETITQATARRIVESYLPKPPLPPLPELPPRPELPPTPEYRDFEREELLPHLHDAGIEAAPQMLSGKQGEPARVSEKRKAQARESLRSAIVEAVRGVDTGDEEALAGCADEILDILGQGTHSIAIAAHFATTLTGGPLTLADLVEISAVVCGKRVSEMDRETYLDRRKQVLRLIDSLSLSGYGIFEHRLQNGQLLYGLMPCETEG